MPKIVARVKLKQIFSKCGLCRNNPIFSIALLLAGIAVLPIGSQTYAQESEEKTAVERRGKAVVMSYCLPCHSMTAITDVNLRPDEWNEIIDEMIVLGMVVDATNRRIIYEYLVSNFSNQPPEARKPPTSIPSRAQENEKAESDRPARASSTQANQRNLGMKIYQDFGCNNCHTLNGVGAQGLPGPELANVGNVLPRSIIRTKLVDPRAYYAKGFKRDYDNNTMPLYELSEHELEALTAYLSSLQDSKVLSPTMLMPDGTPVVEQ